MNEQEILEYNKRCAEFLGGENHPSLVPYTPEPDDMWFAVDTCPNLQRPEGGSMWKLHELKFHSDWNWIHEVIKEIENLHDIRDVTINSVGCIIFHKENAFAEFSDDKQKAVVEAINKFLIWYKI